MEITVKNLQSKILVPYSKVQATARKVCRQLKVEKRGLSQIGFVFVGTKRMRTINRMYLGHDHVTDVITFNLGQSAEIIICPSVAHTNASLYKVPVTKELLLYVIHGLLHLAGYDDHRQQDIQRMRAKEQLLLDGAV